MTGQCCKDKVYRASVEKQGAQQSEFNDYPGRVIALRGSSREPCGPRENGDGNLLLPQLDRGRSKMPSETVRTDFAAPQAPEQGECAFVHWLGEVMARVSS
jgi:hypothetical protein